MSSKLNNIVVRARYFTSKCLDIGHFLSGCGRLRKFVPRCAEKTLGLLVHWKSLAAQLVHRNTVLKGEAITKEQVGFMGFFVCLKKLKYPSLTCGVPLYHFDRLHLIMIETVVWTLNRGENHAYFFNILFSYLMCMI